MSRLIRRSAARRTAAAAVLLGALGIIVAVTALGASAPAAPSITANPATSPTSSATMTFTFSSPGSGNTYACGLDTTPLTACTSPRTYGSVGSPVGVGSHTFRVQAIDKKGAVSTVASYSWVVERTPPTVSSITRVGASPTNASSVQWTVTFSEAVANVTTSNFALVAGGLTGAPVVTGVSGSGATRTVTASTGTSTTGASGTLGLNLSSAGSITDLAGNALSGSLPAVGQVYVVDKKLAAPVLTVYPDDPNGDGIANFEWTVTPAESGLTFTCQIENFAFVPCTSPYQKIVDVSNNQQHQFVVRALDPAGNTSQTAYMWKVLQSVRLTITGNAVGLLYPGAPPVGIDVVLHNPNNFPVYVNALDVTVVGGTGCAPANFAIVPADIDATPAKRVLVPANGTAHVPTGQRPKIRMINLPLRQNDPASTLYNCANKQIALEFFSGSVTK